MIKKEFIDMLKSRRSVRQFNNREVPQELLTELIETAASAPSAGNRRDWEFSVVLSPEIKQQMLEMTKNEWDKALNNCETEVIRNELMQYRSNFEWFSAAPVLVVISCRKPPLFLEHMFSGMARNIAASAASAFMAAENLLLAAHACGLGGCCLTGPLPASEEFMKILRIDRRREIVCLIALGYPADNNISPAVRTMPNMRII